MSDSAAAPLILEARSICKSFPGVRALNDVNLRLHRGEILALVGENGAGKSTLMRILAGVLPPDSGELLVEGKPVAIDSVPQALQLGIALIHQELNLADNLDVGANIFLGREPQRLGLIDKRTIRRQARRFLDLVGLNVSPDATAATLSIGQQQLVEIAKALCVNARVLIMDEPTSSLSQTESARLFRVIRDLRDRGVSVIYVSHRLAEVRELADRVAVLRDGENAGELIRANVTHDALVRLMVGRDVSQFYARRSHPIGDVILEVDQLRTSAFPEQPLSFAVRSGEIIGVAGLVGSGRTELLRALFGVDRAVGGEIRISGAAVDVHDARTAIAAGMALAPEDRKSQGLILDMALSPNVSLPGLFRQRRAGLFRDEARERKTTRRMVDALRIKTPSIDQIVRLLSGGNQQKVVLAKWLSLYPRILLLDEPTRGIDVGAKQEIYRLMEELAEQGIAILFVSSELEEILGMSDRVLVMHEGRLAGELNRNELTEEVVMQLATGAVSAPDTLSGRW